MKQIIFGVVCGAIIILSVINCLRFHQMQSYNTEFQTALSNACDQVSTAMTNGEIHDNTELKTYFKTYMSNNISDHSDDPKFSLSYKFIDADADLGLFSVYVKETYSDVNKQERSISDGRTIIIEEELPPQSHTVRYEIPTDISEQYKRPSLYHEYQIEESQPLSVPDAPSFDSLTFSHWRDSQNNKVYTESELKALSSDRDYTFVAVFQ